MTGRSSRAIRVRSTGVALALLALGGGPLSGQQARGGAAGDTVPADTTLTAADSARVRIRDRLQALSRAPGTPPDTLPMQSTRRGGARGTRGGRPAAPPADMPAGDSISAILSGLPGYRITRYSGVAAEYRTDPEVLVLYGSRGWAELRGTPPDSAAPPPAGAVPVAPEAERAAARPTGEAGDTAGALAELPDSLRRRRAGADSARAGRSEEVRASFSGGEGEVLQALRTITYRRAAERVDASGDPTFSRPGGDPVVADSLAIDVAQERASAFNSRSRYSMGTQTEWNVSGNLPWVSDEVVYGAHTRFTSCDREDPHYHFQTDHLKIIRNEIMVARPVRLYFADVPVAWLPFIAQSLGDGRASGLLTPRFSVNDIVRTNSGFRRRISNVGFYWVMNDYVDATVALDWFDDNFTAVTGSLRYRWLRQFLNGTVNFRQFWRAEGGREQSLDVQTSWQASERTDFRASIQYASSTDFVRRQSFDPREVTQRISSSGGMSRRFDWGTLNLTANRQQSLSNDEVTQTLPNVSLSLSPLTLFQAPQTRAQWYNNLNWSGSARFSRQTRDLAEDTLGFSFRSADTESTDFSANSNFTLGAFNWTQSVNVRRGSTLGVPADSLVFFPDLVASQGLRAFDTRAGRALVAGQEAGPETVDVDRTELTWSTSVGYQQNLIGSTTLTPQVSISGRALRDDTISVAQSFVSAPNRISFGARLKTDLYGFYPGVGPFQAIRHKVSTSVSYDWSPAVEPNELQTRVFGSREVRPRSVMSIGFNQTWEAKREEEVEEEELPPEGEASETVPPPAPADPPELGVDDTPPDLARSSARTAGDETGPRRLDRAPIVNLLSIRTSVLRYDFVEADSLGFLAGFETTTLQNQISSDFLRGLTISMTHDLFEEVDVGEGESATTRREFSPHLQSMNFGFNLTGQSAIVRWLGLGGSGGPPARDRREEPDTAADRAADDPFYGRSATDESSILPGRGTDDDVRRSRSPTRNSTGDWRANFRYSLNRPREGGDRVSQLLTMDLSMTPTPAWELSWATAYDLERSAFNDHRIRLTRDLHRWQAHFDFLQTTTGNWTFRFEVSLLDNQDLNFDYEQRNVESSGGRRFR